MQFAKKYSVDVYEEGIGSLDFPNYQNFENINDVYSKFAQNYTCYLPRSTWLIHVVDGSTVI